MCSCTMYLQIVAPSYIALGLINIKQKLDAVGDTLEVYLQRRRSQI